MVSDTGFSREQWAKFCRIPSRAENLINRRFKDEWKYIWDQILVETGEVMSLLCERHHCKLKGEKGTGKTLLLRACYQKLFSSFEKSPSRGDAVIYLGSPVFCRVTE